MQIQSYQIHNVLNVYRRQLSQGKTDAGPRPDGDAPNAPSATTPLEGNSQSVMEKVTANVLKKITNVLPAADFAQEMGRQTRTPARHLHAAENENEFVFNTIADDHRKETRSIAIDNSRVLMSRLDELAKAAVHRKAEETK